MKIKSLVAGLGLCLVCHSSFATTVGFAQVGSESGWRTSFSESVKAEAKKRGIDLKFSDAQQKQENQIKAVRSFIAQGVDAIIIAPVPAHYGRLSPQEYGHVWLLLTQESSRFRPLEL